MVASLHIRHAKCLLRQHLIIEPTLARIDNIARAIPGIRRSNENPSDVADIHIYRTSFHRLFFFEEALLYFLTFLRVFFIGEPLNLFV